MAVTMPITSHPLNRPPSQRAFLVTSLLFMALFTPWSGFDLGHYSLWDDEANTALIAEGVIRTGDTSATVGENIVAYRGGAELNGTTARYLSPLQYYVAAASLRLFGINTFAARLPFWLFGLATVALILYRLWRQRVSSAVWYSWLIALLGSVSFILYIRQCRYYSLTLFFTTLTLDQYLFGERRRARAGWVGLWSALTFVSNYLNGVALIATLAMDAWFFQRSRGQPGAPKQLAGFGRRDLVWLALPHLLLSIPVFAVWNPLGKGVVQETNTIVQKLHLFIWNLRDAHRAEFAPILLLLVGLWIGWKKGHSAVLRMAVGALVYFAIIAFISPQPVRKTGEADIRYLLPTVPLLIHTTIEVWRALVPTRPALVVIGTALGFWTTVLHVGHFHPLILRSTPLLWAQELRAGPPDPYTAATQWLRTNAKPGESVLAVPSHTRYPLMFQVPSLHYAWQFPQAKKERYPDLPSWQFEEQDPPDIIISFGEGDRYLKPVMDGLEARSLSYSTETILPVFGKERFRPELFLRVFREEKPSNPETEGIRIFRRTPPSRLTGPQ